MNKKILKTLGLLILFQIGLTGILQAAIFKCVNGRGDVFYNDRPCPAKHNEKILKHSKDPKNSAEKSTPIAPEKTNQPSFKLNESTIIKPEKLDTSPTSKQAVSASGETGTLISKRAGKSATPNALDKNNPPPPI